MQEQGRLGEALAVCQGGLVGGPPDARILALGGVLAGRLGNSALAVDLLRAAVHLSPGSAEAWFNLAVALARDRRVDAASDAFRRVVAVTPGWAEAWFGLAGLLLRQDRCEEARAAFHRVLEIAPDHGPARHMTSALDGANPDGPAGDYVRRLFDDYAGRFEAELIDGLGYRTPDLLRSAVEPFRHPGGRFRRVLDLGCGTGLLAPRFRDLAGDLPGVNLSPNMIAKAREKGLYDTLAVGDMTDHLGREAPFDLVLAADVLVYLGRLEPLFAAVAGSLTSAGIFAFSIERLKAGDFRLLPTGRYAHGAAYIHRLGEGHGMTVLEARDCVPRHDKAGPVAGIVFVLGAGTGRP